MRSIKEIVKLAGGPAAVGRKIGRTSAAVSQWKSIPRAHVRTVSELSGLPVSDLMPDVFADGAAVKSGKRLERAVGGDLLPQQAEQQTLV